MLLGYARVSSDGQKLDLQTDALTAADCTRLFTDTASGALAERPSLTHALDVARPGGTLVIWRLDRLGRSLSNLIELVRSLDARGVGLRSLHEGIDTTTATGRLVFHVFGALAEFERDLNRERSEAGREAMRARGRTGGRKPSLTEKQKGAARAMLQQADTTVSEVAEAFGVSRATLYRTGVVPKLGQ